MDINRLRVPRTSALGQRAASSFVPGIGYLRLGEPPLPVRPINPPSACVPPEGTPDGSRQSLSRLDGPPVILRWLDGPKLWEPTSPIVGNRLAFRPAYLAALGWKIV